MASRRKQRISAGFIMAFALVLVIGLAFQQTCTRIIDQALSNDEPVEVVQSEDYLPAEVDRVVDGDTIVVNINGINHKVRLIGIDAPESVSSDEEKNCKEGELASAYLNTLLKTGQAIYLEKDQSDTDIYDRLLRYVWLEIPTDEDPSKEAPEKMLNAVLVANGYACSTEYKPDTKYNYLFNSLQETAKKLDLGVSYYWA